MFAEQGGCIAGAVVEARVTVERRGVDDREVELLVGGVATQVGHQPIEGVVELLGNGSGFVRVSPPEPSDGDVYISAAQVRRCELVSGDRLPPGSTRGVSNELAEPTATVRVAGGARVEVSAIKVAAPDVATWVIDRAIQAHGGAGAPSSGQLSRTTVFR